MKNDTPTLVGKVHGPTGKKSYSLPDGPEVRKGFRALTSKPVIRREKCLNSAKNVRKELQGPEKGVSKTMEDFA